MIERVVITDALLSSEAGIHLHPALKPWEKVLLGQQQLWQVEANTWTPLSYFADMHGIAAAAWLASLIDEAAQGKQFWLASPYHARLTGSQLRVMPEPMLDWSTHDAARVCEVLNPLLVDEGMSLHQLGSALLVVCDRVWDVQAIDFARISGNSLPNRQPDGIDAGVWMRILTEIQMTLYQSSMQTAAGTAIHGLWLWGAAGPTIPKMNVQQVCPVATRHAYLQALLQKMDKERDASVMISQAEDLPRLLQTNMPMPKDWLLMGEGQSVALQPSLFYRCLSMIQTPRWKGVKHA